jgi:glutaconate CoA-transferase subunit B
LGQRATKATFDFEPESRRMRLIATAPWATKEEVLSEMGFEPLVAERVETLEPPTEEELTILRTELDVWGLTQQEGRWVEL